MKRIKVTFSVVIVAVILGAFTFAAVRAAPRIADGRVDFGKETSNSAPCVGETFTFKLRFGSARGERQPIYVRVVDPNPASLYLQIVRPSITGGASYSPTIDAVVWEGMLVPGVPPIEITFDTRVTGIPVSALANGHPVTNIATMADLAKPGSLPEQTAQVDIRIQPIEAFLPLIASNPGG
jgi:hypothetical protein